ncbi:MAG TPA: ABC transporter substrate-binding protein [Burkholderiales bacterium]|jgi:branched-chain amino acid transport system substrate-binding protein|nr:ABC transporter substrate-binding protein [Burkholderiales bacterium]
MKRFLAVLALALVGGVASAQDTIRIGVITDRVGVSKPYSEPATEGLIFGAEEINRRGGVLGRKIELLIEDDQSRPDISAALARKLIDQGALFIISMSLTPATQQQQTVTMEAKTPQMTPMNSGDTLTTQLPNPYFWQTGPLGSIQIATLLAHARAKSLKRVALITDNSDLGQLLGRFFKAGLEKSGIQVVAEEVVPRGATTATPQMQKIRAANPDAMFMAGVLTAENVLIFKAYREFGLKFPIHSSYNLSVPVYMSVAKGLIDGVTFVDAYDPEKPEVKAFEAAYKKATGKDPFNLHGYGYDGIMMVAEAIRRAGSTDKEKIRAAMQSLSYAGVMGARGMKYSFPAGKRAGFDPNGMVVRVYEGDKQGRVVHVGQK